MKRHQDTKQLLIDWAAPPAVRAATVADHDSPPPPASSTLVQVLPWNFCTSFPQPTEEAIDSSVLDESDRESEALKALHQNYANQCIATLKAIDTVMSARRKGIDPGTGKVPRTHAARERLRKYLNEEPTRLEHTY